ncbi:carbohydrate-binding module family 13 protein [Sphaerobolus stellatus SS14]|uniref:Carbohydrate-binding module family 13 protein n=1 Tax=Sphaerobolus stellatus (strain SS14) TaxID=990650 RepID=A0A0C9UY47_SPHS4|nr:carbohydrate-binding module family 13 protein [Sphaerobolus stellatus SS14]
MSLGRGIYPSRYYSVRIALQGGSNVDNTSVVAWGTSDERDEQLWFIEPVSGEADTYTVRNLCGGSYMDLSATTDGTSITGFYSTKSNSQKWVIRKESTNGQSWKQVEALVQPHPSSLAAGLTSHPQLDKNKFGVVNYEGDLAMNSDLQSFFTQFRPDAVNSTFAIQCVGGGKISTDFSSDEACLDVEWAMGFTIPTPVTVCSVGSYAEDGDAGIDNDVDCDAVTDTTPFQPSFPGGCPLFTSVGGTVGCVHDTQDDIFQS